MNGMSTGHFVGGISTTKQILLTNGAIGHVFSCLAIVIIKQQRINAHATIVAVTKVFTTPDSTKSTVGAMIG
jgi:hypothetical protein